MTDRIDPPDRLTFPATPTPEEATRRLGATSCGPVYPPTNGLPGYFNAVVDRQLCRYEFVVEASTASAADKPTRPRRAVRVVRTPIPASPEVERQAVEANDRARRPEVERRHFEARLRLDAHALVAAVRSRGALPAYALSQPAVLASAATFPDVARRHHLSTADCASCGTVLVPGDGSSPTCRACRTGA